MPPDHVPAATVRLSIAGIDVQLHLSGLGPAAMEHLLGRKFGPFIVSAVAGTKCLDGHALPASLSLSKGAGEWKQGQSEHCDGAPIILHAHCTPGSAPYAGHEPEADRDPNGRMTAFRHRTSRLVMIRNPGNNGQDRSEWRLDFGFDDPRPVENALRVLVSERLRQVGGGVFHAAGIAYDGCGWLFPGISGAGKTTLSIKAGRDFVLSDEMPAVRLSRGAVARVPEPVEGRDGGVDSLVHQLHSLHATPYFGDMGHGTRGDSLPLAAIILLLGKDDQWCRPATPAEARQHLLSTYVLYAPDASTSQLALHQVESLLESGIPVLSLGSLRDEPFASIMRRITIAM